MNMGFDGYKKLNSHQLNCDALKLRFIRFNSNIYTFLKLFMKVHFVKIAS